MSAGRPAADPEADTRPMSRTYVGVIVVEVVALLALWIFQWYFS